MPSGSPEFFVKIIGSANEYDSEIVMTRSRRRGDLLPVIKVTGSILETVTCIRVIVRRVKLNKHGKQLQNF